MLFLKTFGGMSVEAGGALGAGAGQRRKTLALLALLAAGGNHGMSRDKLIAFLWPDTDISRGRNLLKQACFTLRHDLHAPELFLGVHEVRLNPDAMDSDVQQFESELQGGSPEQAVEFYVGPFLDGFYLTDAARATCQAGIRRSGITRRVRGEKGGRRRGGQVVASSH